MVARWLGSVVLLLSFVSFSPLFADATPAAKPAAGDAAGDAAAIPQLIKQLDANSFPERQQASNQLSALGNAAIPALTEAALGGNRETMTRAIDILKSHLKHDDEATKTAAKQSLEKIAQEGKGPAAKQAELALRPKPAAELQNNPFGGGGIQIGGGQVQIQVQMQGNAGGNGRQVTSKIINGVKTIEATDKDRKVKIHDDPNKGITVEVTETKDGKETTKKYEAKDRDELKKKHPEADKLYDEFGQAGGQVQIQFGAIPALPLPGNALPALPVLPAQPNLQNQEAFRLDILDRQLEGFDRQLKAFDQKSPAAEQLSKAQQQIDQLRKTLKEAKEKIAAPPAEK